jgi:hypothetical protein
MSSSVSSLRVPFYCLGNAWQQICHVSLRFFRQSIIREHEIKEGNINKSNAKRSQIPPYEKEC